MTHYRQEVEEWKRAHDEAEAECFVWQELFARANQLYSDITKLADAIRKDVEEGRMAYDAELSETVAYVIGIWLDAAEGLLPEVSRVEREYGSAEGGDTLRENIRAAAAVFATGPGDDMLFPEPLRRPLSERDEDRFLCIIEDDSQPNESLLRAAKRFRKLYA